MKSPNISGSHLNSVSHLVLRAVLQRARLREDVRHPAGRVRVTQVLRGGFQEQPEVRHHRTDPEPTRGV